MIPVFPDLKDQVAVVTGASRGLGAELARELWRQGCRLALVARNGDELQALAASWGAPADRVACYPLDVTGHEAVHQAAKEIQEKFGRIDVVVNNAGITRDNLVMRMKEEEWDRVMAVNLKGTFNWTGAVSRIMMRQQAGSIINIASVIGIRGNAGQSNYAASKAGIIAFTRSVAKELGAKQVRVNAIAPGVVDAGVFRKLKPEYQEEIKKQIPLGFFGQGEDVAGLVVYLASSVSRYVTGQTFVVDGGLSL